MANVTILGAGMMGSALSVPLVDNEHQVRLVGTHLDGAIIESLKQHQFHPTLKVALPKRIQAYALEELSEAFENTDYVVLGVSSAGVSWAAQTLSPLLKPDARVLMISKGLQVADGALRVLPDVFSQALPPELGQRIQPVAIAGPCIAGELVRRVPTCVVLAGRDAEQRQRFAELLKTPYYFTWPSSDVVGAEVCAALKNAYAMAMAFASGLHEREGGTAGSIAMHNYEAAVFAESVWEMQRMLALCGGKPDSAVGLPGVGDLDVTCNGGRTGRFGRLLGLGLGVAESIRRMEGATLECLEILRVLRAALPSFEARGELGPEELPLLRHMLEVALDDQPVNMPFSRFFQQP